MIATLKHKLKGNAQLKQLSLWLLMPTNQAKPRRWVRWFLNPFIHKFGKGSLICGSVRLDVLPFNKFTLGARSTIEDFCCINNGVGDVFIGSDARIGLGCTIIGPVTIGNNVMLAQSITVSALNHGYQDINLPISKQPITKALITIGEDSWVGANSIITSGVTIGKHVVIAGGSVVVKNVPAYTVVGGNPAKVLKSYNHTTQLWEKPQAH